MSRRGPEASLQQLVNKIYFLALKSCTTLVSGTPSCPKKFHEIEWSFTCPRDVLGTFGIPKVHLLMELKYTDIESYLRMWNFSCS